jgi:hypothetical protein
MTARELVSRSQFRLITSVVLNFSIIRVVYEDQFPVLGWCTVIRTTVCVRRSSIGGAIDFGILVVGKIKSAVGESDSL